MDLQLHGKVALVTGGASGIGESVVRALYDEGCRVHVADKNRSRGEALATELGAARGNVAFHPVDLREQSEVSEMVRSISETSGRLDILVNNAAQNDSVGLDDGTDAFRKSIELNLIAVYGVTHACLGLLRKSRGTIVNVGSKVSETGQGGTSGYAASKGGVSALTREWALDLLSDGIRVNQVNPAEVRTPLYDSWLARQEEGSDRALARVSRLIPLGGRLTEPGEIANMIVFLASPRASHVTGQLVFVDGGYTHLDRALTS